MSISKGESKGYSFFVVIIDYWFTWSLKSTCLFSLGPFWRFQIRRKKKGDLKKWKMTDCAWDKISMSAANNWLLCFGWTIQIKATNKCNNCRQCSRVSRAQNNAHVTGKMVYTNNQFAQDLSKLVILKAISCVYCAAKSSNRKIEKSEHVCFSFTV